MKFRCKRVRLRTGGPLIVLVNSEDARVWDLHPGNRVLLQSAGRKCTGIIDVAGTNNIVRKGVVGVFDDLYEVLRPKSQVIMTAASVPESVLFIKKKLDGHVLVKREIRMIVEDIVANRLSDVELTYFVAACYNHSMTPEETVLLTEAIAETGDRLRLREKIVVDKHCIGGLCGNRTTPLIVAIVAAVGLVMPKTSSRSITSPAGTADTMEVFCPVNLSIQKMKQVVRKTNACMAWGGAMNLAPADDKIIRVEKPLAIDAESQLLASILAKKASVGATHVLIDIPVGQSAKVKSQMVAKRLKNDFIKIGKRLGMRMKVMISDGSQPVGNGIGPALEARDVLWVLQNDKRAPRDLREKSLRMAGMLLGMGGKGGYSEAVQVLDSGEALRKFTAIVRAQGGSTRGVTLGKYKWVVRATRAGKVNAIDNDLLSRVARLAGAPDDKGAGILLQVHLGDRVRRNDVLFEVMANNALKLGHAKKVVNGQVAIATR